MRDIWQRYGLAIILLVAIASQISISLVTGVLVTHDFNHVTGGLKEALYGSCQRLNIERARSNHTAYNDYLVFQVVQQSFKHPDPRQVAQETPAEKVYSHQLQSQLKQAVNTEQWVPLTDCLQAVNVHGAQYRPPPPIYFHVRLPLPHALALPMRFLK